jgi:hypothetical protein
MVFSKALVKVVFFVCAVALRTEPGLAAEFIDPDYQDNHRYISEDFAKKEGLSLKELENRTSATGVIRCGTSFGSANVITSDEHKNARSRFIVTVAHIFYKIDDDKRLCKRLYSPDQCEFHIKTSSGEEKVGYSVETAIFDRTNCTSEAARDGLVVLKLERPVPVVPYIVRNPNKTLLYDVHHNEQVTVVAGQSADYIRFDPTTHKWVDPKHFETCNIKDTVILSNTDEFYSACDCGEGCSGGAIIDGVFEQPNLIGVARAVDEPRLTKEKIISYARTGKADRRPYDSNGWRLGGLRVSDDVYDSLERAAATESGLPVGSTPDGEQAKPSPEQR